MKLNYTGRTDFLRSDHYCDMENIFMYICLGVSWLVHGCLQAISWVFKGTSRLFQKYFVVILEYVIGVPWVFLEFSVILSLHG